MIGHRNSNQNYDFKLLKKLIDTIHNCKQLIGNNIMDISWLRSRIFKLWILEILMKKINVQINMS